MVQDRKCDKHRLLSLNRNKLAGVTVECAVGSKLLASITWSIDRHEWRG